MAFHHTPTSDGARPAPFCVATIEANPVGNEKQRPDPDLLRFSEDVFIPRRYSPVSIHEVESAIRLARSRGLTLLCP